MGPPARGAWAPFESAARRRRLGQGISDSSGGLKFGGNRRPLAGSPVEAAEADSKAPRSSGSSLQEHAHCRRCARACPQSDVPA